MDLTKLSDSDLAALQAGDLSKVSDDGLAHLAGTATTPPQPAPRAEGFVRGLKDPLDAAVQMFEKAMPEGFNRANRAVNNWLAAKTGLVAEMPEGGVNELIANQEKAYQARRAAAGQSGIDGFRLMGNIVSPVNLAIAAKAPAAATMAGRLASGAGVGAISSVLSPADGKDFWAEKARQAALGAAFGAAVPAVTGAAGRLVSPKASTNAELALLKAEGVRPTVGQTLGGVANRIEEKAQSLPIIGDAITMARQRSTDDLNRAVFNRALAPIGEKLPSNVSIGNDAVEYTHKALGAAYDGLIPKLTTQADDQFMNNIGSLRAMVAEGAIDPKYASKFEQILTDRVLGKFQGQGVMTGETAKATQEHLAKEIQRFAQSQDPDARLLGDALKEVGSQLNALMARANPKYAEALSRVNAGYANFKRVQKAASTLGADDGVFTPAQLHSAVKAADRSKDKARFAEGLALMQDLSAPAKAMLSNKVPDSGTAGRVLLGTGALGTYLLHPMIPASLVGGAALYTPQAQTALRALVSSRPESAQAITKAINAISPSLTPAAAQFGLHATE